MMEVKIPEAESLAMQAAELIVAAHKVSRFGYCRGFGLCGYSVWAMKSDYVRIMAADLGIKLHFDTENARKMTGHPCWLWLEKI